MSKTLTSFLFLSFLSVCLSCSQDESETVMESSEYSSKILFTKSVSEHNTLLVKFDQIPEQASLNRILQLGAESITPLFPSTPGKESLERQHGLDRWYEISVSEDVLEMTAKSLCELDCIRTVEYNLKFSKASDCVVYPLSTAVPSCDILTKADAPFNDPNLSVQWNFKNYGNASIAKTAYKDGDINVYDVWRELTGGNPSVIVAIVDEGVKYSHPDLQENMWTNDAELNGVDGVDDDGNGYIDDKYGYNFVSNGPVTWTCSGDVGHATHCAGIVSAVNNNAKGISSVAGGTGSKDGTKIMSCQIFSGTSGGTVSQAAKAFKYAADMGASILSCSFGYAAGEFKSDGEYRRYAGAELDALAYFESTQNNQAVDGGIPVFASGNEGEGYACYPGALSNVISVSAYGPDFLPTYYTNYGPGCKITAPGGESGLYPYTDYSALVLSAVPSELYGGDDYGYMQGTSMACPHVAGIAALGISRAIQLNKTFTATKFKEMLVTSAKDFDSRVKGTKTYVDGTTLELYPYRNQMGTGGVDAWLFMMKLEGIPCLIAQNGVNQWLDLTPYFGSSSTNLTYLGVEFTDAQKNALGLAEDPYIEYGRLFIHPTKNGSAKFTVKAIGGGDTLGGDDTIGGMEISQEVSVIVRSFKSTNGGWL